MYLYLSVEMYLFVGLLVLLYMNEIQVLWNVNIHNFITICVQLLLVLVLGDGFRLLNIIITKMVLW